MNSGPKIIQYVVFGSPAKGWKCSNIYESPCLRLDLKISVQCIRYFNCHLMCWQFSHHIYSHYLVLLSHPSNFVPRFLRQLPRVDSQSNCAGHKAGNRGQPLQWKICSCSSLPHWQLYAGIQCWSQLGGNVVKWLEKHLIFLVGGESWRRPFQEGDCCGWPKLSTTYQGWRGTSRATSKCHLVVPFLIFILISVYLLGGRSDIRVQSGKRDLIQRHLQLLRQDGPI